ncbi:uncharacterized protein LOC127787097 [Diospyros lotus]|uniref:uncharacterized protein LOC127787097 n=1 Tax=Diospyros lotus TaxID=55363 RepID=UPI00224D6981|nr:uncharacterized protein LOC127787097 [Diospyros lotus]
MAEDSFEEGMLWLPSHVLDDEAGDSQNLRKQRQPEDYRRLTSIPAPLQPSPSLKLRHRGRQPIKNWAVGGPGMQAIFLDSGRKPSSGTGVFLPRRDGADFSKRPSCSPILLPSRVVQALHLNVHELQLQFKSARDTMNDAQTTACSGKSNKRAKDASAQRCVISQSRSTTPEIFLPKEWTY